MFEEYMNISLTITRVLSHNKNGEVLLTSSLDVFCSMYFENKIIQDDRSKNIIGKGFFKTTTLIEEEDRFNYNGKIYKVYDVKLLPSLFNDMLIYEAYFV